MKNPIMIMTVIVTILSILVLNMPQIVYAGGPPYGGRDYNDVFYPQVGVEWMVQYRDHWWDFMNPPNLDTADDQAQGFYNVLHNQANWEVVFDRGNHPNALPEHWAVNSWTYIDGVDIAYYAGHGNANKLIFRYDEWDITEQCIDWGSSDLEWVMLHSCKTLQNYPEWWWSMNGLHLVCGFVTDAWGGLGDYNFGIRVAELMVNRGANNTANTVRDAWELAARATQPSGTIFRVLAEEEWCFDDFIWGQGTGPKYGNTDPQRDSWKYEYTRTV